jgi:DNA-binding GntR family transcriptional regulator
VSEAIYKTLAGELRDAIARGDYAVGTHLPTEHELCAARGVSRHTAREALRILREEGLIARRRGAGTIVTAPPVERLFTQTLGDLGDLLQYARDARLDIRFVSRLTTADAETVSLGLDRDERWARIDGLRRRGGDAAPVALTRIYVRADLCPPTDELRQWPGALNELIAKRSGVSAGRIEQEIAAVALTRVEARTLEAETGAPALKTIRRYRDQNDRLFQASLSVHPGDRFVYAMRLSREGR